MSRRRRPLTGRATAAVLAIALAACGYRTGLEPPPGYRTVGLEVFDNASRTELVPNLERDLQAALGRAVSRLLDATIVPPDRADLVVGGSIVSYRRRRGIQDEDNNLLETGIRVTVDAELRGGKDDSGDNVVLRRTTYSATSGYVLADFDAERLARERVLENIAERLVLDLFAHGAYEP